MVTPDQLEPLIYANGKVHWSESFKTSAPVQKCLRSLIGNEVSRVRDLGAYLYFVFSPRTSYKALSESDRIALCIKERTVVPDWLPTVMDHPDMRELVTYYRRLSTTPVERIYLRHIESIHKAIEHLSNLGDSLEDSDQLLKSIENCKKLIKGEEELRNLMVKEKELKTYGSYIPSFQELPPDQR